MDGFKEQRLHRHDMERRVFNRDSIERYLGLGAAFVITLAFLGIAGYAIHLDHTITGSFFGASTITGIAGTFILGRDAIRKRFREPPKDNEADEGNPEDDELDDLPLFPNLDK